MAHVDASLREVQQRRDELEPEQKQSAGAERVCAVALNLSFCVGQERYLCALSFSHSGKAQQS